jgi:hypothetical protein
MKSAVDFLWDELECLIPAECQEAYVRAKKMEAKERSVHYLFIGKVSDVIGAKKTIDLLKETLNETK